MSRVALGAHKKPLEMACAVKDTANWRGGVTIACLAVVSSQSRRKLLPPLPKLYCHIAYAFQDLPNARKVSTWTREYDCPALVTCGGHIQQR